MQSTKDKKKQVYNWETLNLMGESEPWTSLKQNGKSSDGYIHKFLWFFQVTKTNLGNNKDRKFVKDGENIA